MPLIRDTNYREIPFKIKPVWALLILILIVIGLYLGISSDNAKNNSFYKHKKVTTGIITDLSPGFNYDYYFISGKKKFYGRFDGHRFSISLINMKFPVAYDSLNPNYSEMLTDEHLYKELNLSVPDSINFDTLYYK